MSPQWATMAGTCPHLLTPILLSPTVQLQATLPPFTQRTPSQPPVELASNLSQWMDGLCWGRMQHPWVPSPFILRPNLLGNHQIISHQILRRASQSAKPTVLNEMNIIYLAGCNDSEWDSYNEIIFSTTILGVIFVPLSSLEPILTLYLSLKSCYDFRSRSNGGCLLHPVAAVHPLLNDTIAQCDAGHRSHHALLLRNRWVIIFCTFLDVLP